MIDKNTPYKTLLYTQIYLQSTPCKLITDVLFHCEFNSPCVSSKINGCDLYVTPSAPTGDCIFIPFRQFHAAHTRLEIRRCELTSLGAYLVMHNDITHIRRKIALHYLYVDAYSKKTTV